MITLNQSRLACFDDCKRRYYYTFEANLDEGYRSPLETGSAVHEGLAALECGRTLEEAVDAARQRLLQPKGISLPGDEEQRMTDATIAEQLIRAYAAFWERSPWTTLATEVYGTAELAPDVRLKFRIDKIVNWRGRPWLLDHKTAAKLDLRRIQKIGLSRQMLLYAFAAEQVLDIPVAGMIVDFIVKTIVPQFHRELFTYTAQQKQEIVAETVEAARDIAYRRRRVAAGVHYSVPFYRNLEACRRYGNCPFLTLCESGDTSFNRGLYNAREPDYVDTADSSATHPHRESGPEGDDDALRTPTPSGE